MSAEPSARLLDVTRLLARADRSVHTGIDRVELAYLREFLRRETPLFGLIRTHRGYLLLDREGLKLFEHLVTDGATPRRKARAILRWRAIGRALPRFLGYMLRKRLPQGMHYFSIAHINLTHEVFAAVRSVPGARIVVMIHDVIPLDFPQFQPPGKPEEHAGKLAVATQADVVLFPTEAARDEARPHFEARGGLPCPVAVHLGVPRPDPRPDQIPDDLPRDRPYFVILGSIEPRKNHALLLDIWEKFHATRPEAEIPYLFILGSRGWKNEAVFDRLDNSPFMGRTVFECPGLSDGAVAALLEGAAALLQPSHAEGFGLPPVEAAALGTPVVCAPLPVFKETLGDIPVYASLSDSYLWETIIDRLSAPEATGRAKPDRLSVLPTWDDHFKKVLAQI